MAHLDNKYLVSMHIHAGIDVVGTKVVRVQHTMCFDPVDSKRISK